MKIYHKLVRADNPDVTKFISKFIPPGKGLALDVGCGEGYLSKILKGKGYFAIGIDKDSQMLKIAFLRKVISFPQYLIYVLRKMQ
jgi:2-polyprenyl-3-methyl-5-hydroxy-6-metoxy-1,4-benzoquinol methylase